MSGEFWSIEDQRNATREGWDIFECHDVEHAPFELQKIDDDARFEGDADVWLHVWNKAQEGSVLHVRALDFLDTHANAEFLVVRSYWEEHNQVPLDEVVAGLRQIRQETS